MATAANTNFVTNLYTSTLLRSGSTADINGWATMLDSGPTTQAQVVTAFQVSAEAVAYVDPIVRLYETELGRAPDAAGFKYWENQLATTTAGSAAYGAMLNGIAASFAASAEFTTLYGAQPTATAYVTALYTNALARAPDAGGLAYWVGQLSTNNAATRGPDRLVVSRV